MADPKHRRTLTHRSCVLIWS